MNKVDENIKAYSYQDFKEDLNIFGDCCFKVLFVLYGFLQFFATWELMVKAFHHDNIIILLASIVLGFFPIIGTGFGIYGAYAVWGWDLSYAIFVFIVPYFIVNGPLLLVAFYEYYKDCKRWKAEEEAEQGNTAQINSASTSFSS